MYFRIEKSILDVCDTIYNCAVVVSGLDNNIEDKSFYEAYQKQVSSTLKKYKNTSITSSENIVLYRHAMDSLGINSAKYPSSIESIINRIIKNSNFPSINPVVDLGNYISLKYEIPVGIHDIDSIHEDLCLRMSTEEDIERFNNENNSNDLIVNEPVYATGNSIRTRKWFWKQMPAGRISRDATNFIFTIDGFFENKEIVNKACEELVSLLQELFNIEASFGTLNKNNPEFRFGPLTNEEKEIENQISIMLKGVAQHTSISEIRNMLIESRKEKRPLRVKLGLDPSAPDIHIGHAVVLRKIRQLQDMGHIAVIIIGDFTGMIGDPTGKSKTRKPLSPEDVKINANTYLEQIFKIIDKTRTEVHYNSEWLSEMSFKDIIELSSKCTVARMLERDDFQNRYTNHLPLSLHEFFYPLMQAYDSVAINADIELGGTDQTFNILMGRNIQRDYGQKPQLTLFMPLLEGIDGIEKMSKSLNNYIGINEEPTIIYEKVMKIPDSLIIKYYNLCTDSHPKRILEIQSLLEQGINPRDIKMLLAHEITELYYDSQSADNAECHFKSVFQKDEIPYDAPTITINNYSDVSHGEQIIEEIAQKNIFKSKSEIRRIFLQGGVKLDGTRIINTKDIKIDSGEHILRIGKRNYFKIII